MAEPRTLPTGARVALGAGDVEEFSAFLRELMLAAGPCTLAHFRTAVDVENKRAGEGRYDPVTAADRAAETLMRDRIAARYPQHGIFGEEHGYEPGACALTWVIDPIDGTRAFITGQVHWGILIGLYDGERPVLGGMYQPFTGELFIGEPGRAWTERGGERRRLAARACAALSDAVLYCTTPDMFRHAAELAAFERLAARVQLRRFGGDCYSYCMLAHGQVDLVVEAELQAYDVQGLIPVVEGAGGIITDWRGATAAHGGRVIAAGDARLHAAALEILSAIED